MVFEIEIRGYSVKIFKLSVRVVVETARFPHVRHNFLCLITFRNDYKRCLVKQITALKLLKTEDNMKLFYDFKELFQ